MQRGWLVCLTLGLVGGAIACGPTKGGDDGVGGSADGSGDAGDTAGSGGPGHSGGVDTSGASTAMPGTGASDTDDDSTTGEVFPAACVSAGWDVSLAAFEALSEANDGTYYYGIRTGGSDWTTEECFYWTTVEFVENVAVRRSLAIESVPSEWQESDCTEQPWVEEIDALGSHTDSFAAGLTPVEAYYKSCCQLLATEPAEEYWTYFGVDENGVMSSCEAELDACLDSCQGDGGEITIGVHFGRP